jgi:hypothetical protein
MTQKEHKNLLDNPVAKEGKWCEDAKRFCCLEPSAADLAAKGKCHCFLGTHIECMRFTKIKEELNAQRCPDKQNVKNV